MSKWVYSFGADNCDGDASLRNLLGGKGANLAEMSSIGLLYPPALRSLPKFVPIIMIMETAIQRRCVDRLR